MRKAIVLLSGGLDSTTCLYMAKAGDFDPVCLTVDYGQRHAVEIARARMVARRIGVVDHRVVIMDLRSIGGCALTDDIPVPKHGELSAGIPVTYVPARNTIFLGLAMGLAEVVEAKDIFIGVNVVDYSGYPDCRPEFIRVFQRLTALATRTNEALTIHAPLSNMSKAEIIRTGIGLGVDYSITHSCYDPFPSGEACTRCDSCLLRKRGFDEVGIVDPRRHAF